jgi:dTDP-4-dehydrorhamnose reductase
MIVVIGATGQVGTAFGRTPNDVLALSRRELDLATMGRKDFAEILDGIEAEAVVNCAAYTAVDRAESESALAYRVNAEAVGVMAEVCADRTIPFVTYSTDYVFDGLGAEPYVETDPTDPINAYGASKLAGERRALVHPENSLVVRTSWVVSGTHPNFVATMLRLVGEGRTLKVVDDQHGRPTVASDLAAATIQALAVGARGLLHLANEGATTWFELARAAVSEAGLDPASIEPCGTDDYPTPAARPAYSVLDTGLADSIGVRMPHWRASLPSLVRSLLSEHGPDSSP